MATLRNLWVFASLIATGTILGGAATPGEDGSEACQTALLRNGFTVQYAKREAVGPATRLWLCGTDGFVEIPGDQIAGFQQMASAPAVPPAAPAGAGEVTASREVPGKDGIKDLIATAASRHQLDPDFVASVVKAESGFNPAAVSARGAQGLMQLMPRTAAWLGVNNVLDPAANVEGGAKYLRRLLNQYGGDAVRAGGLQCRPAAGGTVRGRSAVRRDPSLHRPGD